MQNSPTHSINQKRWAMKNPSYAKMYRDSHKEHQHEVQRIWRNANPERYRNNVKRSQRKKVDFINSLKDKPCADCGIKYPSYVMHFDHRNPVEKFKSISQLRCNSYATIKNEIAKCDLVCANCHAVRTYNGIKDGTIKIFGGI